MAYELFLRAADKLSRLNQWDTRAAIDMLEGPSNSTRGSPLPGLGWPKRTC